jgi:ADP-heptose:LPS heptosyltransferase
VALTDRPRLLVLRALGLGDFLTGVPALRALRRAAPDHELVLAAPRVLEPLVALGRVADRVLDIQGLQPPAWTGPAPELAVNLHGKGPQSHRLLSALRPGRLVGFASAEADHRGPPWADDEHEVRRWCRLVAQDLRVPADPADLHLAVPEVPAAVPGAVVVHPGAAYPARRWPPERFARVARWAVQAGRPVVITGGPGEVELAHDVRRAAGLPEDAVLAGRTGLTELAAQVAAASLVVCGDTGLAHLATAFSTPSVVLFGPMSPSLWGPPAAGPHVAIWHGSGTADPWGERVDPALLDITVDEVLRAAGAAIRGDDA